MLEQPVAIDMYDAVFTRTTMEHDEDIAGGIFMCNQTTMPECLSRQLFGLPKVEAAFVKGIKAGMSLFLFEYEERRLYGLFKAASDGVINSVPDAFSQSGRSYPAQVFCLISDLSHYGTLLFIET